MGSNYYNRLETQAKHHYAEKLMSVGLSIENDPFLPKNDSRFDDSLRNWPRTEFGHIFTYFVSAKDLHTRTVTFVEGNRCLWIFSGRICQDYVLVQI